MSCAQPTVRSNPTHHPKAFSFRKNEGTSLVNFVDIDLFKSYTFSLYVNHIVISPIKSIKCWLIFNQAFINQMQLKITSAYFAVLILIVFYNALTQNKLTYF